MSYVRRILMNEPNLPGFWEHADMQEYFKLFRHTFIAVKEVDTRFPALLVNCHVVAKQTVSPDIPETDLLLHQFQLLQIFPVERRKGYKLNEKK